MVAELTAQLGGKTAAAERAEHALRTLEEEKGRSELDVQSSAAELARARSHVAVPNPNPNPHPNPNPNPNPTPNPNPNPTPNW